MTGAGFDRRQFLAVGTVAAAASATSLKGATRRFAVLGLRADFRESPLGIDNPAPTLSWQLESGDSGVTQQKYRILVASSRAAVARGSADIWDSGEIASRRSFDIAFAGRPPGSRQRCWWRVIVWDDRGRKAESEIAWWEMGLLPDDWKADWLTAEDAVGREDRAHGLRWISGPEEQAKAPSRQYRFPIRLAHPAREWTLMVGSRSELAGVWVDGAPIPFEPRPDFFYGPRAVHSFSLPSLSAGDHMIAVSVTSYGGPLEALNLNPADPHLDALALFVRLSLEDQTIRLVSGPDVRTSLSAPSGWTGAGFDDSEWNAGRSRDDLIVQPWPPRPAVHLRREFAAKQGLQRARLYATALGAYEARLNGERIGDAYLTPGYTDYRARTLYQTYDVTRLVRAGANVLGFLVGDGWYASELAGAGRFPWEARPRRLLAQLELTYSDGTTTIIPTGPGWRLSPGAVLSSEIYDGEIYDARAYPEGWDRAGFIDKDWERAPEGERPGCRLSAGTAPPIRATGRLKPVSISSPAKGVWVFDLGQNFAGWCRLRTTGPAGTRIEMKFGETLYPSGRIDQSNLRGAKQRDIFILRGTKAAEEFAPHFTYHGFRYVEVTGLPLPPTADTLEGIVVHNDLPVTGHLRVDQPLIHRLWRNSIWTQRSNIMGVPTDCPQRDERLGWLADASAFWSLGTFNMDCAAFTREFMRTVGDSQSPEGVYPRGAPYPTPPSFSNPMPAWSDGAIILIWINWQRYGDTSIIRDHWEGMNRYLQFIGKHNPDGIWRKRRAQAVDWMAPGAKFAADPTTPLELIATAYWARGTELVAEMAEAIGRRDEASGLRSRHDALRDAFIREFVRPDGTIGNGSQTSHVLALKFGLLPSALRAPALEHLVADIRRRGGALATGFLGTQFLLEVLADGGYPSMAYDTLLRKEYPSWGHMIARDATTIWEGWDGRVWAGPPGVTMPNSYNHFALGAAFSFLFTHMAGIAPASPGFERIRIRPLPDPRVARVGAEYDSIVGRISTDWVLGDGGRFDLRIQVPANSRAEVILPSGPDQLIRQNGRPLGKERIKHTPFGPSIEVGSGSYQFRVS